MNDATTMHEIGLPPPDRLAHGDFEFIIRRLADDLAFGTDNSLFLGSGLEYASSRPYQPGDSIRLLNWRLTARTGRPFVRQYEALKRTSIFIVLDTSASMSVSSTVLSKHDVAVWLAAALGLIGQRRMSPVALAGAGERTVPLVASLSRNDLWRSLEPLRTRSFREKTRLGEGLRNLTRRAARSSVFVVLSDLHDTDAVPAIRNAAHKHDCVVIHTQDPAEVEPLHAGFVRAQESETGRVFLGRSRYRLAKAEPVRNELLRCGADYLALRTDESFIGPLRHFLGTRGGFVRGRR